MGPGKVIQFSRFDRKKKGNLEVGQENFELLSQMSGKNQVVSIFWASNENGHFKSESSQNHSS